jgi:hypothetical protein
MEAIATYEGVWFEGRYTYELFPDSLRVVGTTFLRSNSDLTVRLAHLQLKVDRFWVRSRGFDTGLGMFTLGLIVYVILVSGFQMKPTNIAPGLAGIMAISGLIMSIATVRKTEFAVFVSEAGYPAVGIPRSSRDRGHFQEFVERVLEQVRACKDQEVKRS